MNILFVTPSFPDRGKPATGFHNYLYRVSLALLQLGHKPIILTAGKRNGKRIEQGIEIRTVQILGYADSRSKTVNYAVNAVHKGYVLNKEIHRLVKKMHIDVVQFTSLEAIALFYREDVPAVLRLSSYARITFSTYETHSRIEVKVMAAMERMSAGRCRAVFAPCRNTAKEFARDIQRKVHVVETPFVNDVQTYDSTYVDTYLNGKKYVLFFGTLYAVKGILVIAEILREFLKENPEYYFVFIGDVKSINGESPARILQKAAGEYADRILIGKALPHEKLYPVIRQADFVVMPSLMDNLPNACIEAMYFQRVVIGTDGASFEQLITHGENGLLCKIGDARDLLEKMQMAVHMDNGQKELMGKKAQKRIDRLKPEYAVKRLLRLYGHITEE